MKQHRGALAVLSLPSLIAAKHSGGGGPNVGWIVVGVVVLLIVGYMIYTSFPGHSEPEEEPDEQTLRAEELVQRLRPLDDWHYRHMCFALARGSRAHQGALADALDELDGLDPVQDDDGEG